MAELGRRKGSLNVLEDVWAGGKYGGITLSTGEFLWNSVEDPMQKG